MEKKQKDEDVVVKGRPLHKDGPQEPVKAYKLLDGKEHMHDNVALQPGDIVYFSKGQAEAFKDKFAAVDDSEFEAHTAEEYNELVETELERRANAKKDKEA